MSMEQIIQAIQDAGFVRDPDRPRISMWIKGPMAISLEPDFVEEYDGTFSADVAFTFGICGLGVASFGAYTREDEPKSPGERFDKFLDKRASGSGWTVRRATGIVWPPAAADREEAQQDTIEVPPVPTGAATEL